MIKIKLCGIYKIEHISGYYYIGMSVDIFSRWNGHYTDIKMLKHSSNEFVSLFISTRIEDWTFSILEYISVKDLKLQTKLKGKSFDSYLRRYLLKREKYWMSEYSINFALNKNKKSFKK
jgi:predicted GIY-YIG superfamily endonuclease